MVVDQGERRQHGALADDGAGLHSHEWAGDDGAPAIRGAWRDPLARMAALIADGDEWMPPARTVVLSCRKGDASAVALDLLTEHLRAAGSPSRLLCVEGGCAAWQLNHLPMEEAAEAAV